MVREKSKVLETKKRFRKNEKYFLKRRQTKIMQYSLCDRYFKVTNQLCFSSLRVFNVFFTREVFIFKDLFSAFQCFLKNYSMQYAMDVTIKFVNSQAVGKFILTEPQAV